MDVERFFKVLYWCSAAAWSGFGTVVCAVVGLIPAWPVIALYAGIWLVMSVSFLSCLFPFAFRSDSQ